MGSHILSDGFGFFNGLGFKAQPYDPLVATRFRVFLRTLAMTVARERKQQRNEEVRTKADASNTNGGAMAIRVSSESGYGNEDNFERERDVFGEDEENIVPITEDDDIHFSDVDDVEVIMTDASEGNGLDVEDDV
ncbi:hypothetical protein V6N12_028685 [Hibiscus sabdariffa]|uniref:Uncharacterized protein n=1 Tax=Hibiscus sabdariffa TaxID=183260 RepID=A0ABR2F6P3_9ROSI